MLTEQDIQQIKDRGSQPEVVENQLAMFQQGFPFMELVKPASPGNGLWQLADEMVDKKATVYEQNLPNHKILKFVPASGAASRMFKALASFLDQYAASDGKSQYKALEQNPDVSHFFKELGKFPFFEDLQKVIHDKGQDLHGLVKAGDYAQVLHYFLKPDGLGYESLPKGLLKFHKYREKIRTPFEEHLVEGAHYATSDKLGHLHFTVSPEHDQLFREHQQAVKSDYEGWLDVNYDVGYSYQEPSTDTIAVDLNNEPLRDDNENLVFRPGGHGALLDNLNQQNADIIFIKNIDNVVPDRIKAPTYRYKKLLGGVLLEYQEKIFSYLKQLEQASAIDEALLRDVEQFLESDLCILPPEGFDHLSETDQWHYCKEKLNRPLRVCGMVKNEGEPGGGPFWVKNSDGSVSLQIVEKSQINMDDPGQKAILDNSTHFNPVDLACATKNFKGEKFHLPDFRDDKTGFISQKSKGGKDLKALELPGLWNGAMAHWNTIFVEVPIITFNPVKTIVDLLRENHQAELAENVE